MSYDSCCLDSENRVTSSTLSVPTFKINPMKFQKGDKIRLNVCAPPIYNIDSTNDSITIDTVAYTITDGFYNGIDDVIKAFNTAIVAKAITIAMNDTTGLITFSHASTNFDLSACSLFGIMTDQTGDKTYTGSQGNNLNKSTLCFCSNLISLFNQLNFNKLKETYHPKNYIFSFLSSSVNSFTYISSEWLTVNNTMIFDEVTFAFGYTGSSPSIYTNIIFNWSVILEIFRP